MLHLSPAMHEVAAFSFDGNISASEVRLVGGGGAALRTPSGLGRLFKVDSFSPPVRLLGLRVHAPLHVSGGELELVECVFEACDAGVLRGGALLLSAGSVKATSSSFVGNVAMQHGGALFASGGDASFINCSFAANVAGESGGAISLDGDASVQLSSASLLRDNRLLDGSVSTVSRMAGGNASTRFSYVLPAPLGRWAESFGGYVAHPLQVETTLARDYPYACAPGAYGGRQLTSEQAGPWCSGLCPPGASCPSATVTPTSCTVGHYCPAGSVVPTPCEEGTWSNATGVEAARSCRDCPAGHACRAGATAPAACRPGRFAAGPRRGDCSSCPGGSYQNQTGQTQCKPCGRTGYYCELGASAPLPCPPGTYQDPGLAVMSSAAQCTPCPPGTACSAGSSAPTPCDRGKYNPVGGRSSPACLDCGAGTYQDETHATACRVCRPGGWCHEAASIPVPCAAGTVGSAAGLSSPGECTPVQPGYWAPTGSAEGVACPTSGFYCPGALLDDEYNGSRPIITEVGSLTSPEKREVVERVEVQLTLEQDPDSVDVPELRSRLEALYRVPVVHVTLGVGSTIVHVTILRNQTLLSGDQLVDAVAEVSDA